MSSHHLIPAELCITAAPLEVMPACNSKDSLGAVPHKYQISDIDPRIQKMLTVDMGTKVFTHQLKLLPRSLDLLDAGYSFLPVGATGIGKTYKIAAMLVEMRRLMPERYPEDKLILYITKKNVVMQTQEVFRTFGVKNFLIASYDSLGASFGDCWIEWKTVIKEGRPELLPIWCDPEHGPCLILCDECHSLKNPDSTRSKIIRQAGLAGYQVYFTSASPFSRAAHLKTIALVMAPLWRMYEGGPVLRLNETFYPQWLKQITDNPLEWNAADMRRAMKSLQHHILHYEKIQFAHLLKIRQIVIPFQSPEHARIYASAMEEYQQARIRAEKDPLTGFAAVLVALKKFNQESERLRAPYLAKSAWECVNSKRRPINAIIACGYKDTLFIIKSLLITKYQVPEGEISIIEGGQNAIERQKQIKRFNSERNRYMLLMFTAGGAGLSLHHTKAKKYPSEMFAPPVWNSEDMIQIMGRPHRVNSESTTYINFIWFSGTVEEDIAERVKGKCAALKEVVGKGESWVDGLNSSQNSRSSTKQISAKDLYEKEVAEDEDEDSPQDELAILGAIGDKGNANALIHKLIT